LFHNLAVRPEIIAALEVPWHFEAERVEEFHRVCALLYKRAENNRCESRTLAALRDALLPKLLSGELRRLPSPKLRSPSHEKAVDAGVASG
jgi:type I restriction enzyme S subunit